MTVFTAATVSFMSMLIAVTVLVAALYIKGNLTYVLALVMGNEGEKLSNVKSLEKSLELSRKEVHSYKSKYEESLKEIQRLELLWRL